MKDNETLLSRVVVHVAKEGNNNQSEHFHFLMDDSTRSSDNLDAVHTFIQIHYYDRRVKLSDLIFTLLGTDLIFIYIITQPHQPHGSWS